MAFDIFVDSFTLSTALGLQSVTTTALTFTPTGMIVAANRLSSDGTAAPAQLNLGVTSTIGATPFHRRTAGFVSDDNEASGDAGVAVTNNSLITMFSNSVTLDSQTDIETFDSAPAGFTVDVDNDPSAAHQVCYALTGGDLIIEPFVMNFGTSAGNRTKTGLTNQPKAVVFFAALASTTDTTTIQSVTATPVTGWMCADGSQGYAMTRHTEGSAAADTARRMITSKCFGMFDAAGTELVEAEFVAMTTQGFTVNLANAPTNDWRTQGFAIYGSTDHVWTAGSFTASTSTGTMDVVTTGVDPKFTILQMVGTAASTATQTHGIRGIGMTDGTRRFGLAYYDRDGNDPTDTVSGMDRTNALICISETGSINDRSDVTHSTGKFIVDHNLANGVAAQVIFLVGGTATSTGGAPTVFPRPQRFMTLGVS